MRRRFHSILAYVDLIDICSTYCSIFLTKCALNSKCPCCPELNSVAELCNVNYLALNYTTSYKDKLIVFTYFEPYARHFVPQFVNVNADEKPGMQLKKR